MSSWGEKRHGAWKAERARRGGAGLLWRNESNSGARTRAGGRATRRSSGESRLTPPRRLRSGFCFLSCAALA